MKSCDVLIFGCGYLGIPVARSMLHRGHRVVAVTRSPTRARFLETLGLIPFIGDWLDARSLHGIPVAQHTLVAVGFDRQGSRSQRDVYVEGLRNALGVLNPDTKLVYCSSTGVYHQFDGVWVDESSPCRPTREGERRISKPKSCCGAFAQIKPPSCCDLRGYMDQDVRRAVEKWWQGFRCRQIPTDG